MNLVDFFVRSKSQPCSCVRGLAVSISVCPVSPRTSGCTRAVQLCVYCCSTRGWSYGTDPARKQCLTPKPVYQINPKLWPSVKNKAWTRLSGLSKGNKRPLKSTAAIFHRNRPTSYSYYPSQVFFLLLLQTCNPDTMHEDSRAAPTTSKKRTPKT